MHYVRQAIIRRQRAEGVGLGSRQIGQETLLKHELQKGDRNLFLDVQAWAGGTVLGTKQTVQKHIRHIGDTPVLLFAGNGRRVELGSRQIAQRLLKHELTTVLLNVHASSGTVI